jgi:hypothetical protein
MKPVHPLQGQQACKATIAYPGSLKFGYRAGIIPRRQQAAIAFSTNPFLFDICHAGLYNTSFGPIHTLR